MDAACKHGVSFRYECEKCEEDDKPLWEQIRELKRLTDFPEVKELLDRAANSLKPLVCLKCGEPHPLGHCLNFQRGMHQPTLDEAMKKPISLYYHPPYTPLWWPQGRAFTIWTAGISHDAMKEIREARPSAELPLEPSHIGPCGPEAGCDGACMDYAAYPHGAHLGLFYADLRK